MNYSFNNQRSWGIKKKCRQRWKLQELSINKNNNLSFQWWLSNFLAEESHLLKGRILTLLFTTTAWKYITKLNGSWLWYVFDAVQLANSKCCLFLFLSLVESLPCVVRCSSVQTHPWCSWPSDRSDQTECSQSGPECAPAWIYNNNDRKDWRKIKKQNTL